MAVRESLTYVEIDVDFCANTYGVSPCTASIPTTGDVKCYNCKSTCQDRPNYNDDPATIRFAKPCDYLPADIDAIPSIKEISFSPAIISLGADLGQRASLNVRFTDHRHPDTGPGFDPYLSTRTYNAYEQGTFFGKFRARHPYLVGAAVRRITGYVGQALADMETRHFIVESFDGPRPDGTYEIIAKDILKLADGSKAQAPILNTGFLQSAINTTDTAATLSPVGVGALEYAASGYLAIGGSEIVSFTRVADALTITRAQLGTEAVAHSTQDRVQVVIYYASQDPADILYDLLVNYAGVQAAYIPLADWQQETTLYLQRLYTGVVAEPIAVNKHCSELIEQAGLAMWWDDADREIKLQVLRGILTNAERFTVDNRLEETFASKEQPEKRLSQVWTYYGKINPLKGVEDTDNYRSAIPKIDTEAEDNYGSPAIKKIFSRWIPALGQTIAQRVNAIQLGRFRDPPRRFNFDIMRYGPEELRMGMGANLSATFLQDASGADEDVPIQITRLNPDADRFGIEAEEMRFVVDDDFDDRVVIIDINTNNVNARTVYDLLFPDPESGDEVFFIIETGVIVGSTTSAAPAFDVGSWPVGVILNLEVRGRIQGKGGAAGRGGNVSGGAGLPGDNGGDALYTRFAITIDGTGEIFAGGGGGGGGGAIDISGGGGGGGGQGQTPGAGGGGGTGGASPGQPGGAGTAATTETNGTGGSSFGAGPGGAGGQEGQDGTPGTDAAGLGGAGGVAGDAIDGVSFVTIDGGASLTITGTQVN